MTNDKYDNIYTVTKRPSEKPKIHKNKKWKYKDLKEFVGGLLEYTEPMSELPNVFCYIDDEGLLKNLPMNFTSENRKGFYVGPAVFFGSVDWEGNNVPMNLEEAEKVVEFLNEHDCNLEYKTEDFDLTPRFFVCKYSEELLEKMTNK